MFLDSYQSAKRRLLKITDEMKHVFTGMDHLEAGVHPEDVAERIQANRFNIVVVGRMKQGKSKFINALLRSSDLLPEGRLPVSSAIVGISWDEAEICTVFFKNGTSREISYRRLSEYCEEAKNPGNRKEVAHIRVGRTSPWLEAGVTLYDTPGVGSLETYHGELTRQIIPNADAILYLFSADLVIGEVEYDFLKELAEHGTEKIIFLLNKSDKATPEEIGELCAYNRSILREIPGFEKFAEEGILPVSSKQAIHDTENHGHPQPESGFPQLEKRLESLIRHERADAFLANRCTDLRRIAHDAIEHIDAEQAALKRKLQAHTQKLKELHGRKKRMEKELEEALHAFDAASTEAETVFATKGPTLEKELKGFSRRMIEQAGIRNLKTTVHTLEAALEEKLNNGIREIISGAIDDFIVPAVKKVEHVMEREPNYFSHLRKQMDVTCEDPLSETFTMGTLAPGAITATGGVSMAIYGHALSASSSPVVTFFLGESLLASILGPAGWALMGIGGVVALCQVHKKTLKAKGALLSDIEKSIRNVMASCETDFKNRMDEWRTQLRESVHTRFREELDPIERAMASTHEGESEKDLFDQVKQLDQKRSQLLRMEQEIAMIRKMKH